MTLVSEIKANSLRGLISIFSPPNAVKKLSVKRMRWTICEHSSSSSEEDVAPFLPENSALPETSSDELSTIEESHLEDDDTGSSSSSEYISSYYVNDELSSVSSLEDQQKKTTSANDNDTLISVHPNQLSSSSSNSIPPNDSTRDEIVSLVL